MDRQEEKLNHLRDPTRDELHSGPTREKLPEEIQQMPEEDTACSFCGVSYFIFAEVQDLKKVVKQYKIIFNRFMDFTKRERCIAKELRDEVARMQTVFDALVASVREENKKISSKYNQLHEKYRGDKDRVNSMEVELERAKEMASTAQSRCTQLLDEVKASTFITEQKLRNEAIHATILLEKSKSESKAQIQQLEKEVNEKAAQIQQLEASYQEAQKTWSTTERQRITERDELKQRLQGALEAVEISKGSIQTLSEQLEAIKVNLSEVVAENERERATNEDLSMQVADLAAQIHILQQHNAKLEKAKNDKLAEELESRACIQQLKKDIAVWEAKFQQHVQHGEDSNKMYTQQLADTRQSHSVEIQQMQQTHEKAIVELKRAQEEYVDGLKKELIALKEKMERARLDKELKIEEARKIEIQLREEIDVVKTSLKLFERDKVTSRQRMQVLQSKINELGARNEELEQKAHALESTTDGKDEDIKRREKDLKEHIRHAQEETSRCQSEVKRLRKQLEDNQLLVSKLTAEASAKPEIMKSDDGTDDLRAQLEAKEKEVATLRHTVHKECLERTLLLEQLRGQNLQPGQMKRSIASTNQNGDDNASGLANTEQSNSPAKATLYEKLRKSGRRKGRAAHG